MTQHVHGRLAQKWLMQQYHQDKHQEALELLGESNPFRLSDGPDFEGDSDEEEEVEGMQAGRTSIKVRHYAISPRLCRGVALQ